MRDAYNNTKITDEYLDLLIEKSHGTALRTFVDYATAVFYRSIHHTSSKQVVDAAVLNILFNEEITITSAEKYIRYVQRKNRAFTTSVSNLYKAIEDKFIAEVKAHFGECEFLLGKSIRPVSRVVYAVSLYTLKKFNVVRNEVFSRAFDYKTLFSK